MMGGGGEEKRGKEGRGEEGKGKRKGGEEGRVGLGYGQKTMLVHYFDYCIFSIKQQQVKVRMELLYCCDEDESPF